MAETSPRANRSADLLPPRTQQSVQLLTRLSQAGSVRRVVSLGSGGTTLFSGSIGRIIGGGSGTVTGGGGGITSGGRTGGGGIDIFDGTLGAGGTTLISGSIGGGGAGQTTSVPEPSTLAMMLLGFAGVGFAG